MNESRSDILLFIVKLKKPKFHFSSVFLGVGIVFLYAPLLILVFFSFNESRLVTVWGGFSLKWYGELFQDSQILNAAWRSIRIAFSSATAALVLGTLAAYSLIKFPVFRGRRIFELSITAPLVIPDVILGLSFLLTFVAMDILIGFPSSRGLMTIFISHTTLTMAFVTIIVVSRLREMDESLEEAAMDLGAHPFMVFFLVILPTIAPALVAGWLLAFTLSLDDLVIASFVSGPASTTLPIQVFSSVRLGITPKINALATLLVSAVFIISVTIWWLANRYEKRQREIVEEKH